MTQFVGEDVAEHLAVAQIPVAGAARKILVIHIGIEALAVCIDKGLPERLGRNAKGPRTNANGKMRRPSEG